jgi:hypothetical protein
MKAIIALFAAVLMLSSCEFQQDPLSGASDAVRNGRPPEAGKPVSESPYPKEALQIDSPSVVNGRVGNPVEFQIAGRVAVEGVTHTIAIDNLSDFPGATFDQSKGLFSWVPQRDVVGSVPSAELILRVSLVTGTTAKNPVVAIEKKNIVMVVVNAYSKPIISYVNGSSDVQAGGRSTMTFEVEDQDALSAGDVTLGVRDCSAYNMDSIAHFVDLPTSINGGGNRKYTGSFTVNLSAGVDALVTGRYCFGLVAISKFGVVSEVYKKEIYIESRVKNTKITGNTVEVPSGQALRFSFSVYDPSGAGQVSVKSTGDFTTKLPGSSITCGGSVNGVVDCVGLIDATNLMPAEFTFTIMTENKSARSTQTTPTNHTLIVKVKAH